MRGLRNAHALLLMAAAPAALTAQATPVQLPDSVAQRVVAFYNAPATIRLAGESRVPAGAAITGDVAVLGGPFIVGGRVDGRVVVINGDLRLERGAVITGRATVVGGEASGDSLATIGGGLYGYPQPLRFRQDASGLVLAPVAASELAAGRDFPFGRTELVVAAYRDFNRVEGLPVAVGPRLRFGGGNPTILEALAIYRTSAGLTLDRKKMGFRVQVEQFVGGGRTARIGLQAYSEIAPIETRGVSERENSLSTFVLHRDLRDEYERAGWVAWFRWARTGWPSDFTLEYRDERQESVAAGDPWSLFNNADDWRPEPLISEGSLRTLAGRFVFDTRNEEADPAAGWHIAAELEQGLGGVLRRPAAMVPGDTAVAAASARETFTHASLDVRRYVRLGPGSRLALRAFAAGSTNGNALPAQRQHTLGGEGSLPGYTTLAFDCGARESRLVARNEFFHPWYGCDRVALLQLEHQAAFPFLARHAGALGRSFDLEHLVRWVAFFDVGRAWNERDALEGRGSGRSDFVADAGLGIRIGPIGVYWAVPLSSGGQGVNFFLRLGRRL